jgi:hypothetical protein
MDMLLKQFFRFTTGQWFEWIVKLLQDEALDPDPGYLGHEKSESLIRLYRSLSVAAQSKFATAVVQCLEGTEVHRDKAEHFYVLLQLIAYIQPIEAKRLVRRLLQNRTLETMEYAKQRLQIVALVAASKFDIDDELLYYMDRSVSQITEFRELLVYFRIFSHASAVRAARFLDRVAEKVQSGVKARQAARQLRGVVLRNGYKEIYRWFEAERRTQGSSAQLRVMSEEVLRQVVPPPAEWEHHDDDYAVLLSALLNSGDTPLGDHLIRFSQVVARVGEEAGDTASFVRMTQGFHITDGEDPVIKLIPTKRKNRGLQLITREGERHFSRVLSEEEAQALDASAAMGS